ncbi:MAG: J domain-containing protein, partial [Rhodanobacteraceae bacterium]
RVPTGRSMANEPTDFLRLYQELGLVPGASLDELRRAYRRRVSELHPDRVGQSCTASLPGAAERLQRITVLYGAATQFHRQHGRLPGSSPPPFETAPEPIDAGEPEIQRRHPYLVWLFLGSALIALIVWMMPGDLVPVEEEVSEVADAPAPSAPISRNQPPTAPVRRAPRPWQILKVGMKGDKVLAVQGEPVSRDEHRWDYGPSWIEFDNGKVSAWYSSPLRPLKYATQRPPPPDPIEP